jgi:hypothetical protein
MVGRTVEEMVGEMVGENGEKYLNYASRHLSQP